MQKKEKKGFSRRSFLKGAAAGATSIAAASLLSSCSTEKAAESQSQSTKGHSWETQPDEIPESDIIETIDTEVVVIGAGFAGVASACSISEKGMDVVVLEKSASWNGRGGGLGVAESKFLREKGIEIDKTAAQAEWIKTCGSRVDEALVSQFFNRSGEAMDWLLDKAEAENSMISIWGGYSKSEKHPEEPVYHMLFGGDSIQEGEFTPVALLYNDSLKAGAQYVFNAPAEQLIKADHKVTGVICSTDKGYVRYNASKGVVLATGDIAGDDEMTAYFAPKAQNVIENQYTPAGVNTGDGHKMGMWAGAVMQDGPLPTMIHPQAFAWFHGPFLFVNQDGKRFFNEATWVQAKSLNIMAQKSGNTAYSIFDRNWVTDLVEGLPYGGGMFWDSFRSVDQEFDTNAQVEALNGYIEAGTAFEANSLEELAAAIDIDSKTLTDEVDHYNELCENGEDTDFHKDPVFMAPIKEGPFYAAKVGPALLSIVGGLQVDQDFVCLNDAREPIEGLYAVGNVAGNLYAIDYPINIPGNSHGRCLTFGYLMGEKLSS